MTGSKEYFSGVLPNGKHFMKVGDVYVHTAVGRLFISVGSVQFHKGTVPVYVDGISSLIDKYVQYTNKPWGEEDVELWFKHAGFDKHFDTWYGWGLHFRMVPNEGVYIGKDNVGRLSLPDGEFLEYPFTYSEFMRVLEDVRYRKGKVWLKR